MKTAPDASLPPWVPPDDHDPAQPVFRTRWARRWALVVLVLMLAWAAAAWCINEQRFHLRVDRAIDSASAQARARGALVEDGLRQGLAQLDGVGRMLSLMPAVDEAVVAAGPGAVSSRTPAPALRERLEKLPALAALDHLLATAADDLGADLIYLVDDAGNCVAASNAGTAGTVVGQHLGEEKFFDRVRRDGSARLFAVGHTTGIPGMYFASALHHGGRFVGVVVVKRNTHALAAMVGHEGAFVVDSLGVVVMAQDPRLLLQALDGAGAFALPPQDRASRYRSTHIPPLRIESWDAAVAPALHRIADDPAPQVLEQRHMEREALDVYVAQPVPEVENLARERPLDFMLLALAGCGVIALVAAGLGGWRSRRSVLGAVASIRRANQMLSVEIAERHRAEGLLHESREYLVVHEARLRALLRSLPEQVWMKDRVGNYLAVNAEFERFQGVAGGEVLGKTDVELIAADRAEHYALQDRATLAAAEPQVFHETEQPAGGGAVRRLEVTKTAVRDERGEVIGVVGIARDMTDLLLAHQALTTSEARFRATFETAGDAILIIRQATIVDCNRRAAELLGAGSREVLLGRPLPQFAPPLQPDGRPSRARSQQLIAEVRHGGMRTFEWRCRRLDESEFDAEITISLFRHNGQNLLQAVLRDVSERRRMIAALEAARDEAERANRSKSVFLANMSHEIRTPLNAVLGFTQLLLGDRKLAEDAHARLRVIHSAGSRLLGLINDVLDLAKIESGGLQVQHAPFDLMQELRELDHLYGAHARAKGLAMHSELALAVPAIVRGDRTKVGQVVANLLGNALKFTSAGHIGLRAWRDDPDSERLWLEVEDTGPGIQPGELPDLFVPFRQGAAGQEKGGTGLGLSLSRDMARAMGGDLAVTSVPGAGTQVRVWLPLPASIAPSDAGAPVAAGAQVLAADTPCHALVIEDDADSRVVLADLLRNAGCSVVEAIDGLEGLALCRSQRFDIVFSDIRMPNMNGVELIERLRADPATALLPVVAVSASSLEHERRFYVENGFQEFIGKPYPFQDVYRALVDFAGVRLLCAEAPGRPVAEPDAPLAAGLPAPVRAQLRELEGAAARGQLVAVGRLMAQIAPEAIGAERWRSFDEAAQAYDFQLLEQRVSQLLLESNLQASGKNTG